MCIIVRPSSCLRFLQSQDSDTSQRGFFMDSPSPHISAHLRNTCAPFDREKGPSRQISAIILKASAKTVHLKIPESRFRAKIISCARHLGTTY